MSDVYVVKLISSKSTSFVIFCSKRAGEKKMAPLELERGPEVGSPENLPEGTFPNGTPDGIGYTGDTKEFGGMGTLPPLKLDPPQGPLPHPLLPHPDIGYFLDLNPVKNNTSLFTCCGIRCTGSYQS